MKRCEAESYPEYFESGVAAVLFNHLAGVDDDELVDFDPMIAWCRANPGHVLRRGATAEEAIEVLEQMRGTTAGELRAGFRNALAVMSLAA